MPHKFELSLNLYSFNELLPIGEVKLLNMPELYATCTFVTIDPTGYYCPGYPASYHVADLEIKYGFARKKTIDKYLLPGKKEGELLKVIRKTKCLGVDSHSKCKAIVDGTAIFHIHLCALDIRKYIDLEAAFSAKEKKSIM